MRRKLRPGDQLQIGDQSRVTVVAVRPAHVMVNIDSPLHCRVQSRGAKGADEQEAGNPNQEADVK